MERLMMNFATAAKSLRSHKFQSMLSMLGILFGAMSFVCMVSLGLGSKKMIQDQLETLGGNVIIIIPPQNRDRMSFGMAKKTLKLKDVNFMKGRVSEIKYASAGIRKSFKVSHGSNRSKVQVSGIQPAFKDIRMWELVQGRFIQESDVNSSMPVCVIGDTVREDILGTSVADSLHTKIEINNKKFEVIGVLESKGFSARGNDQDNVIYVPLSTYQRRLVGQSHVDFILVSAVEGESAAYVQKRISGALRINHRLRPEMEDDFTMMNQAEFVKTGSAISSTMTISFGAAAIMTLIVGGVGIMNITLASTRERIREIGLRMALGARRSDIIWQFLAEGVMISAGGALTGIAIGIGISIGMTSSRGLAVSLSPKFLIIAFLVSASVGIFFSYWPARKASRLNPIDALKHE